PRNSEIRMPKGSRPFPSCGSEFESSSFFRHSSFVIRISVRSMFRSQQDRLLGGAFDLDAMGFDGGIVFERIVNDASIEGVHRFEFHDVAPATDFFGGVLRLFYERVAGRRSIAADVHHDFPRGL